MQVLLDAVADARRGGLHGIVGKVGVPGGRLHQGVTEQFADHRQGLARRQRAASEAVSEIVQQNVLKRALARAV